MPYVVKHRRPPESWAEVKRRSPGRLLRPVRLFNWGCEWTAYGLGNISLLEVLEYVGSLSVLVAVIAWFAGADDRMKQKHYQAWQVINTAQGKGGSGGRADALQELNEDKVPLVGVDVSAAYLQGVKLPGADLRRADLSAADLRRAVLPKADLTGARLVSANLRDADLTGVDLTDADLTDADLTDADLTDADLTDADLTDADLTDADLTDADLTDADLTDADLAGATLAAAHLRRATLARADLRNCDFRAAGDWAAVRSLRLANVHGVRNAPDGFAAWAGAAGAVAEPDDAAWEKQFAATPTTRPASRQAGPR